MILLSPKAWIMIGSIACVILFMTLQSSGNIGVANASASQPTDWKTVNLEAISLPADIDNIAKKVKIEQHQKNILNIELFYQVG